MKPNLFLRVAFLSLFTAFTLGATAPDSSVGAMMNDVPFDSRDAYENALERIREAAKKTGEHVKNLVPEVPSGGIVYELSNAQWISMTPVRPELKRGFNDMMSGGGKLLFPSKPNSHEVAFSNPIFLFNQPKLQDPPCVVRLSEGKRSTELEKFFPGGAWVKHTEWAAVRLSEIESGWYVLELLEDLSPGEYALCYGFDGVTFEVPEGTEHGRGLKIHAPVVTNPVRVSDRFGDLVIPEESFGPQEDLKPIDIKNGFQEFVLGSPISSVGIPIPMPKITDRNVQDAKLYLSHAIHNIRWGGPIPLENLYYFIGYESNLPGIWIDSVKDPKLNAALALSSSRNLKVYAHEVVVFADPKENRTIGDIPVPDLGLNYVGGYLAGIIMRYPKSREPDLVNLLSAAYGSPLRSGMGHRWAGKRVEISVEGGFLKIVSVVVEQAIVGFIGPDESPTQAEAIDAL